MLQQTQVDRVIPLYGRFLLAFPTLQDLAIASTREVIQAWQGLGYYRRAVRLHQLAKIITTEMQGIIPSNAEELIKLPGIGKYTAAAVACFAFNQQIAAIDVNVSRVLHRVLGKRPQSKSSSPPKDFSNLIDEMLPEGVAAEWNQAIMDIGAMFCKKGHPLCTTCPLAEACSFSKHPIQSDTPRSAFCCQASIKVTPRFKGSTRYFRGRVVRVLSGLEPTAHITFDKLLHTINNNVEEDWKLNPDKFLNLLRTMAKEGLISEIKTKKNGNLLAVKLPS